jgi:hypothetical protein
MDKFSLKSMAEIIASHTPAHLGQPTIPPISWAQVGDQVIVILADGRKASASIQDINALMFDLPPAAAPEKIPAKQPTTIKPGGHKKS